MTRDGKIIGYGLLLCAAALTAFTIRALIGLPAAERSIAGASAQLGEAGAEIKVVASGFAQTGEKANAAIDQATATARSLTSTVAALHSQVNVIGSEVTRPCKGPADPDNCGFLAETKKTIAKVGDAVVTTQLQVRHSQTVMDAASQSLTGASQDLDRMAAAGSLTFSDLDGILKRPDISGPDGMIANGNRILASGAGIADTTNKVVAKEAKLMLNPPHGAKATLQKLEPAGWIGLKVAACVLAGAC